MGAYKTVLPGDCDLFVKDSSNTERKLFDSTGALYPGGVKMTPASTAAFTVMDTTTVQTIYNKTLSNETKLMTPTTDNFIPLSIVTWPSTVAHTLVATTGAQTIYDKTLADNVKLLTASTANPVPLGAITWPSTAAHTLVATTVAQDLTNKTLNAGSSPSTAAHTLVATTVAQTLEYKTLGVGSGFTKQAAASTSANISNYGIWEVTSAAAGGVNNYTLAAPSVGVEVVLYSGGVANSSDYAKVYTGSTGITIRASDGIAALYVKLQTRYAVATLIGLSTAAWLARGTAGTVAFSTA